MVKDARTCYFPELVSAHQHNSRLLFKMVDQSVNPALSHASADSDAVWDKSLLCCKGGVNKVGITTFLDIDPLHWDSLSYLSLVNLRLNSMKSS